jgi:hypothetical protein
MGLLLRYILRTPLSVRWAGLKSVPLQGKKRGVGADGLRGTALLWCRASVDSSWAGLPERTAAWSLDGADDWRCMQHLVGMDMETGRYASISIDFRRFTLLPNEGLVAHSVFAHREPRSTLTLTFVLS